MTKRYEKSVGRQIGENLLRYVMHRKILQKLFYLDRKDCALKMFLLVLQSENIAFFTQRDIDSYSKMQLGR